MHGTYNLTLVAASYCVAVIAAYTAIYYGSRLYEVTGRTRTGWLIVGGLSLGTGIWSMHFVGMSAYTMPNHVVMSFNLWITILSWIPAVAASLLALYTISRKKVSATYVYVSALIMGAGISAMHYTGMAAMEMSPAIHYDPTLYVISIAIAIAASGAALVICRHIRDISEEYALWAKIGASLIMGVAICGMHYTGMAAAIYAPNAHMPAANILRGDSLGIATGVISVILILSALWLAVGDFRHIERTKHEQARRDRWVQKGINTDMATGFHNQHHFDRVLRKHMANSEESFTLVGLTLEGYRRLAIDRDEITANNLAKQVAQALKQYAPSGSSFARIGRGEFIILTRYLDEQAQKALARTLHKPLSEHAFAHEYGDWSLGFSHHPHSSRHSKTLIKQACQPAFTQANVS